MTPYDAQWRAIRLTILERDNWTCQIRGPRCKTRANQVDHIIPLTEGGTRLDPINLRAACTPCNAGRQNTRVTALTHALTSQASSAPSRTW